jgi:hypothetical protein
MAKKTNTTTPKEMTKEKTKKITKPAPNKSFDFEIQRFITQIESLSKATDMTMKTVYEAFRKEKERLDNFIIKKGIRSIEKDNSETYRIKPDDFVTFKRHDKDLRSSILAVRNVPRTFLCSLVHHYDAYLGRLLRVAFFIKPELLNTSQRQMLFTDLVSFSSIEAAREYMIEKEIESVIRDSHVAHFEWMEKRFGLTLRKELIIWPKFVEITERRNLFVHCDGIISSQYINVCQKNGIKFEKQIKVGDELYVNEKYFQEAVECILEIGIKLGHVLWRKLQPDLLSEADKALHIATYDLLYEERYELTKTLLNFAVDTLKKKSSEQIGCCNLINLAIAQNFSGERHKALATLKSYDWSATEAKFKLAVAVLEHRYNDAKTLMKAIGSSGSIRRVDYTSWPLFREFRNTEEFMSVYKELFGEEFVLTKHDEQEEQQMNIEKPTKASRQTRAAARTADA